MTVVGLGLIGGSLAREIRRAFPRTRLAGVDFPSVINEARRRRLLGTGAVWSGINQPLPPADLIVLACPVAAILDWLPRLGAEAAPGSVVTDTGSTKGEILRRARPLRRRRIAFVGGHPMAGGERGGTAEARPGMFRGASYFLVPAAWTAADQLRRVRRWVSGLGARSVVVSARDHDAFVAAVSHLPQLLAVALMNQVLARSRSRSLLGHAGPSFREMTRVAASSHRLWRSILATNEAEIRRAARDFVRELEPILADPGGPGSASRFHRARAGLTRLRGTGASSVLGRIPRA